MAVFAIRYRCFWQPSMKTFFITYVIEYVFMVMTLHAQLPLFVLIQGIVALVTVLLVFFVRIDQRAWH
jgi:hypothetical protein